MPSYHGMLADRSTTLSPCNADIGTNAVLADEDGDKHLDILVQATGKTREDITRDIDRDFYLSGAQAKEYGLIDEVFKRGTVRP